MSVSRKKLYIFLTLIAVLAVATMIFIFSAQKAEASSEASSAITDSFLGITLPRFGNLSEESLAHLKHITEILIRKAAHFSEFAALGFFVYLHFGLYVKKSTWLLSWVTSTVYAASDEIHQFFVAGRSPGIVDVLIDSMGALFGIAVMALIMYLANKKRKRGIKISFSK